MRIVIQSAYYELKQFFRMKSVVLLLFGLPLLLIFILGNGLDTTVKPIRIAIWNGDGTPAGRAFDRYASSESVMAQMKVWRATSEEEVAERLRSGRADYGIAIPEGFAGPDPVASQALKHYPGELQDRNLQAEAIVDGFLSQLELSRTAAIAFGGGRLPAVDDELVQPTDDGNGQNVRVGTLVAGSTVEFGKVTSLQYYATAYLVMFLLFSGMSAAISTMEEKERGTLRRIQSLPVPITPFMLGKCTGYLVLALIQSAFLILFTKYIYGVQWGASYGLIMAVCLLTSVSAISLAIILASVLPNRKSIETIFSMLTIVMTFLSGGMISTLGPIIREAGKFTINYWANEALKPLMIGGSWQDVREAFLLLAAIAAALAVLMLLRLGRAVSPR